MRYCGHCSCGTLWSVFFVETLTHSLFNSISLLFPLDFRRENKVSRKHVCDKTETFKASAIHILGTDVVMRVYVFSRGALVTKNLDGDLETDDYMHSSGCYETNVQYDLR